ncbi:MAG: alpha/beta hydrolase [Thermoanaerobaculia bacterium]
MKAILVHGMGRTPVSQLLLARRLTRTGTQVHLFGYSTLSSFEACVERLAERTRALAGTGPFVLIGHSLGAVLIRSALPRLLPLAPSACFFLAPPSTACKAATFFARSRLFRLGTGQMGQRLADARFMADLPVPAMRFRVYAGSGGYRGALSPFGGEPNDGILAVSETAIGSAAPLVVPSVHTFIMNSRLVADDILREIESSDPRRIK